MILGGRKWGIVKSENPLVVLDFEPRGINSVEAATLTDRFTSEIGKTEAIRLVDRKMVLLK